MINKAAWNVCMLYFSIVSIKNTQCCVRRNKIFSVLQKKKSFLLPVIMEGAQAGWAEVAHIRQMERPGSCNRWKRRPKKRFALKAEHEQQCAGLIRCRGNQILCSRSFRLRSSVTHLPGPLLIQPQCQANGFSMLFRDFGT